MKRIFAALAFLALATGCHAQLPVSSYSINYSATAPAGCTSTDPCQIAYSYAAQAAGTCPSTSATPPAYALACTSASGTATCTQANAPAASTLCAIAQTVQGGLNSVSTTPITVIIPALPLAPTAPAAAPSGTQTAETAQPAPIERAPAIAKRMPGPARLIAKVGELSI
jgi:hypothetical protein